MTLTRVSMLSLFSITILAIIALASPSFQSPQAALSAQEEPLETVQRYLALSYEGKFAELAVLTSSRPELYMKDAKSESIKPPTEEKRHPLKASESTPRTTVVGKNDSSFRLPSVSEIYLTWLRQDFPKMTFNHKLQIGKITAMSVMGNQAKVSIEMTNDKELTNFPWSFLLIRETEDGKWRIFNITTIAESQGYPFE